jgi:DNA-binding Xre family transcriptional regulator
VVSATPSEIMQKKKRNRHRPMSDNRSRPASASKSNAPTWHKILAINLRRLRADRHITVEALARRTGYTLEFVKKVERGEDEGLFLAEVEPFAEALGVEVSYLLTRRSKDA